MRKRKKTIGSLMLLLILAILAAACSGGSNGGNPPPAGPASTAAETPAASAGQGDSELLADKETTVKVMFDEHPNQRVVNMAPVQQEILRRTNIRLSYETVPQSNYNDKKRTLLATNNLPDIIEINRQDINDFAPTGIFLPLMGYMESGLLPNFKKHWDANPDLRKLLIDGELYAFPNLGRDEAKNGFGPVLRLDLLKKHDLQVPATFAELLTVLQELKKHYPDSVPWTIRNGTPQLLKTTAYMLGSGVGEGEGIYYDKDVDGGRYVFGPATAQFKEVLRYFNEAYTTGVLDPDYAVMTTQLWQEKLTSGKAFFYLDNSGFGLNYTKDMQASIPGAQFQIIPIMENSFGGRRAEYYATTFDGTLFSVSAGVKDPETIIRLIDWMYSETASNLTNYGIEGTHYTLDANGQPQFIEEFVAKFAGAEPTPYYALYSELGTGKLGFTPWSSNTPPKFQIEKMTGYWDEQNDEYWSIVGSDEAYHDPYMDPSFTEAEAGRVKELLVSLNTMLVQEYDKFIMGVRPIDEYDAVIAQAREMGVAELEDIYNNALARADG